MCLGMKIDGLVRAIRKVALREVLVSLLRTKSTSTDLVVMQGDTRWRSKPRGTFTFTFNFTFDPPSPINE